MNDTNDFEVEERVVLSKFDGEPEPENEVERITVVNGTVTQHENIANGSPVGEVEEPLTGAYVGRLLTDDKEVD